MGGRSGGRVQHPKDGHSQRPDVEKRSVERSLPTGQRKPQLRTVGVLILVGWRQLKDALKPAWILELHI